MRTKQIAVIAIVVAIMGYLYMLPVKGLVKPKPNRTKNAAMVAPGARPGTSAVTVETVSATAKAAIAAPLAANINNTEASLKNAQSDDEKLNLKKQLAKQWDDVAQPGPAAFYYEDVARKTNDFSDWLNAGTRFNSAFKTSQDTVLQPVLDANAIESLKHATALKPADLGAKTQLGIAYVNQTALGITDPDGGSPMQGITLLLGVVQQDPKNWDANLNLGLFAMQSRQFDKAVARFKTLIAQRAEVEPYFYLAECYKQLGQKQEAINAYQKCKDMISEPAVRQRIDDYIKELKN